MSFNGTTKSLSEWVSEMEIHHEMALAHLLTIYEPQLESDQKPDPALLEEAEVVLQERLQLSPISQELAHLVVSLDHYLQRWERTRYVLERYREQQLSIYEEAWARWCIIDCLALERKCATVMEQQPALLDWALQALPQEQCFFVMNDTTQALCWMVMEQQEQWLAFFDDLMGRIKATSHNREDRFLYIRTAINVHLFMKQGQPAMALVPMLYQLLQEDTQWEQHDEILLETQAIHIEILGLLERTEQLRQLGKEAIDHLTLWTTTLREPSLQQKRQLRRLCHNLATSFYETKHYDLAIPLFQQAIAYGVTPPHTYLWLAASLWMTTHNHTQVLSLLMQAREHDASRNIMKQAQKLPEFQDILDDPHFKHYTLV